MTTEVERRELFELPIASRPSLTWRRRFIAVLFIIVFDLACLLLNGSQFVFLLPLRLLPFEWSRRWYKASIRYTKGSFCCLLSKSYLLPHTTFS
jgi:hypothetical protein